MYGLLLSSFADAIKETFGEEVWKQIKDKAGVQYSTFVTHQVIQVVLRLLRDSAFFVISTVSHIKSYIGY